ncbi:MAG: hypothetical protein WBG30_03150 [Psychrilyobacter sp.]|uniref:hypothetical protein n=1 Tax=Psychrilyobacter sp. TaxID=2586924 RepID=UPI003C741C7D
MKKLILIGLCLIALGGCTSNSSRDLRVKRGGVLTTIQMSTWMYGTHVLSDDTGKPLTALDSKKINLDMYQGQKVEVQGLLKNGYPIDLGPEFLEVQTIEVMR